MSEGLEALRHPRIKSAQVDISAEGKRDIGFMFFDDTKQYAAIEKDLKRLNDLEMECNRLSAENQYLELEKKENEKKLEALEIIKEMGLYETSFILCVDYDTYCESRDKPIEKEEFDLLKEVLEK